MLVSCLKIKAGIFLNTIYLVDSWLFEYEFMFSVRLLGSM